MGILISRMANVWVQQHALLPSTATHSMQTESKIIKRKRSNDDKVSNKRKTTKNSDLKPNYTDEEQLSLSPRVSPIITTVTKHSRNLNHSLSLMGLFKCQLCRRYMKNKDMYMDHMILCAFKRRASIKVIRAKKD